jgi:hypothetical protein
MKCNRMAAAFAGAGLLAVSVAGWATPATDPGKE